VAPSSARTTEESWSKTRMLREPDGISIRLAFPFAFG
jgi:hypothetical protein